MEPGSLLRAALPFKGSVFDSNDPDGLIDNWGDGLQIFANTITLENIEANWNDMRGINPNANTSLTATHLKANNNGWQGVDVDTCSDNGVKCQVSGAGTVSITYGEANFNAQQGLRIYAKGAVTVTGFYVAGNEGDGYYIDNTFSPTAPGSDPDQCYGTGRER